MEANDPSTAAGDDRSVEGKASAFVFGRNSPPPFSGTPIANTKEKWTEGPMPSDPFINSKTAEEPNSSRAGKGNSKSIWEGGPFATANDDPVSRAAQATDLRVRTEEKPPLFKSFLAREAAKVQKEAEAAHYEKGETSFTTHIDFAGDSVPGLFTGSSSSFPARATQAASTGVFAVDGQKYRSAPIQPKVKAGEDGVAKGGSSKEGVPEIEALKETSLFDPQSVTPYLHNGLHHPPQIFPETRNLGEEASKEDLPKVDTPEHEHVLKKHATGKIKKEQPQKAKSAPRGDSAPKEVPASPSEPSRKERKAAKKAEEKAVHKAENEARNAKQEEKRRVEKAMMMK